MIKEDWGIESSRTKTNFLIDNMKKILTVSALRETEFEQPDESDQYSFLAQIGTWGFRCKELNALLCNQGKSHVEEHVDWCPGRNWTECSHQFWVKKVWLWKKIENLPPCWHFCTQCYAAGKASQNNEIERSATTANLLIQTWMWEIQPCVLRWIDFDHQYKSYEYAIFCIFCLSSLCGEKPNATIDNRPSCMFLQVFEKLEWNLVEINAATGFWETQVYFPVKITPLPLFGSIGP